MCSSCRTARRIWRRAAALALAASALGQVFGDNVNPAFDTIAQAEEAQAAVDTAVKYTCPMHPHYIADEFGACPICGMDLVALETGPELGASAGDARLAITISPEVMQNMGVRLGKAEMVAFGRRIRSYGVVKPNERAQVELTARVEGWVQDLDVRAIGDEVSAGQQIFNLYSPELVVSQADYMRARGSRAAAEAGLSQLRAFGVQERALGAIRGAQRPLQLVPFYAEQAGVVAELGVVEGGYVKRGMTIARIQDYSTVWLIVGVPEKDLGFISQATPAQVSFPNLPDRDVAASVDLVYPTIDERTRTGQARLVIENPDGALRPGGYADVVFEVGSRERVAAPSEAVLRHGGGASVVVSLGGGRFEPKAVETGLVADGWTEILSGVAAGEDVVVSGQFLLDSESALRESFRKLERLQLPMSLLAPSDVEFAMIDHLIDGALYLHEALIDGFDIEPSYLDPAVSIRDLLWPRYGGTQLAPVLERSTAALKAAQEARSESELRAALADLTAALKPWILAGAPAHYQPKIVLLQETQSGRLWIQQPGRALNPYGRGAAEALAFAAGAPSDE